MIDLLLQNSETFMTHIGHWTGLGLRKLKDGFGVGSLGEPTTEFAIGGDMAHRRGGIGVILDGSFAGFAPWNLEEEEEEAYKGVHGRLLRHDALRSLQRPAPGSSPR